MDAQRAGRRLDAHAAVAVGAHDAAPAASSARTVAGGRVAVDVVAPDLDRRQPRTQPLAAARAAPGSALPWWETLRTSTGPRSSPARTSDSASAVSSVRTPPASASATIARWLGSAPGVGRRRARRPATARAARWRRRAAPRRRARPPSARARRAACAAIRSAAGIADAVAPVEDETDRQRAAAPPPRRRRGRPARG